MIISTIAYIFASLGDKAKSKYYAIIYNESFGDFGITNEEETLMI